MNKNKVRAGMRISEWIRTRTGRTGEEQLAYLLGMNKKGMMDDMRRSSRLVLASASVLESEPEWVKASELRR